MRIEMGLPDDAGFKVLQKQYELYDGDAKEMFDIRFRHRLYIEDHRVVYFYTGARLRGVCEFMLKFPMEDPPPDAIESQVYIGWFCAPRVGKICMDLFLDHIRSHFPTIHSVALIAILADGEKASAARLNLYKSVGFEIVTENRIFARMVLKL